MIKIEYYYYFTRVATHGSMTKAAEELYVSQPYLSTVIRRLEETVGTTLFRRSRYNVSLTAAGELFFSIAEQICSLDAQAHRVKGSTALLDSEHKLSISSIYSYTILDIFHRFQSSPQASGITLQYEEMPNRYIPDEVACGNSDLGIIYLLSTTADQQLAVFQSRQLLFHELFCEPLCLVVGATHPLANKETVRLDEMIPFPLIVETIKKRTQYAVTEENIMFTELFLDFTRMPVIFDNNRSLMYYLAQSEHCIAIGQRYLNLKNPLYRSGELKYIPISDVDVSLTTGYLVMEKNKNSSNICAFVQNLIAYFSAIEQIYN